MNIVDVSKSCLSRAPVQTIRLSQLSVFQKNLNFKASGGLFTPISNLSLWPNPDGCINRKQDGQLLNQMAKLLWQNSSLTRKLPKDWHILSNYQAESCWSTLNIPLTYNLVLWNRFLKKNIYLSNITLPLVFEVCGWLEYQKEKINLRKYVTLSS